MPKPITQRSFIRGLDASTSRFDQPKGTLSRLSNLVMTRRGSLITCDGSAPLSTVTNQLNPTSSKGSINTIQQFLPALTAISAAVTPSGAPLTVGTGTDVPASSGTPWLNPNNITTGGYTSAGLTAGPSDNLYATNFNFNIPNGATIHGIVVVINKSVDSADPASVALDNVVSLLQGGSPVGANRADGIPWTRVYAPINPPTYPDTYGSPTDLWSTTWTPAQINDTGFGVTFSGQNGAPGHYNSYIASTITITVYYTGGSGTTGVTGQTILYLQDPDPGSTLSEITGLTLTGTNVVGGTLNPATNYTYTVFALDGQQNSTVGVSASITPGGGNNAVIINLNPVLGAGSYLILQSVSASIIAQVFQPGIAQNVSGFVSPPTLTYTDNGGITPLANPPYGTINNGSNNTIGALRLYILKSINVASFSYSDPVLIAQFPCRANDTLIPNNPPVDASGGVIGASGQVPQMLQFADVIVIGLGNGIVPYYTDGITVKPIVNTFTAQYANWAASTNYLSGDIVQPSPANGHIYICTQGGQSGGSQPAFPTGNAQTVVDNQITWQEDGFVTTSPAPRGAAHIASHAGSLWVFNTQPTNTSDLIDGPSMLRMSDVNNINSWNPINAAYVGKDDGSEGMGLASFTISEFGIAPLGSLILFKNFLPYQVVGVFGAQDFDIQGLQSDMGASAPRSIKFMSGYGILRLTHLGFAQLDGVRDRLISEQIRPYIFGSPNVGSPGLTPIIPIDLNHSYLVKADQITSPPMYAAAAPLQGNVSLSRIFLFDLVLRAWTIIDLPSTMSPTSFISSLYQARTPGLSPVTMVGGFDDGSIQIIQNGVALWGLFTSTQVVNWAFTTPEIFNQQDPSAEVLVDNIIIRGTNLDGKPITVSVNLQTESNYIADPRVYNVGTGEFELMIGINEQSASANALISGSGRVEIESVTWNVEPLPTGVPNVIT